MPIGSSRLDKSITPDYSNYTIINVEYIKHYLIIKLQYDNCKATNYKGTKILVFENITPGQTIMWKIIDPHFKESKVGKNESPSPVARFPASDSGWNDAIKFVNWKIADSSTQ